MKSMNPGLARTSAAFAFLVAVVCAVHVMPAQDEKAKAAKPRKVFTDSVVPLPKQPGLTAQGLMVHAPTDQHKEDKMELMFSLAIPQEARKELEAKVARGETITPKELKEKYAPKAADVDALVGYLKKQGFDITHTTDDRTGVYARATVAQIEKTLEVQMVRVTKGGLTYNAARNAPSLPSEVGEGIRAIIGLQPFRQAHKQSRKRIPSAGNRFAAKGVRPASTGPTPNIANKPPYLVKEVLKAYNADNLGVTGARQTIAILIDTVPDDSDLKEFWTRNGLSVTLDQVKKINVSGGQLPAVEGEETLDVEWSTGIAPGATVRVYASGSLSFVDLDRALDQIIADLDAEPAMRQLSISLGLGETYMGGPQGEVATEDQLFLKLAAVGVNTFVSSGDAGSNPDDTGHSSTGPLQVEYESSDPWVIGVGGTNLTLDPTTGQANSELGWSGSGGGKSILFSRPSWQKGNGVPDLDNRLVPDVSLVADPETGAFVYLQGQVQQYGGTSWSAPTWAGFCALINEARMKAGKPPLGFLNPQIYPLLGSACFRDITQGTNGAFNAGPGYDMVTGIGVPNVRALINALAGNH
jgi:kumamolisin